MQIAHYTSARTIDDLLKMRLRVSKMTDFNDPFEFHFCVQEPSSSQTDAAYMRAWAKHEEVVGRYLFERRVRDHLRQKSDEYKKFWSTRFRTLCCANLDKVKSPDDVLMWSHYAEEHKGVRIHFSESFRKHQALGFESMDYNDSMMELSVDMLFKPDYDDDLMDFLTECLRRKSMCWEWQQEFRATIPVEAIAEKVFDSKRKREIEYIRLESGFITRIDFGIQSDIPESKLSRLISVYPGVKFYRSLKCTDSYSCRYQPLEVSRDSDFQYSREKSKTHRRRWKNR